MQGDKNSISKIYEDIRQSGYVPPVWKRAQVQGLKESRLTIRGDEDRGIISSEEVWTSPVMYSPPPC